MDTFFEWSKIFKTKSPKKKNICDSRKNSRKNFFVVSMIGLHK